MRFSGAAFFLGKRIVIFALGPVLSAVASLAALPSVTSHYGVAAWGSLAIGISIGMGLSVLGELGWSLDGPVRVARSRGHARDTVLALSLATKLVVLPPVVLVACVVATLVARQFQFEAALAAAASALLGLSCSWFFVGIGRPLLLIATDSIPKLVAALLTWLLLSIGAPLAVYPVFLIVASIVSPVMAMLLAGRKGWHVFIRLNPRRIRVLVTSQLTALRGRAASAIYIALPTAIVGVVAPFDVASFAAVERLQRMVLTLTQAVPNALLHWATSTSDSRQLWRRTRAAIAISATLGAITAGLWIVLGPFLASVVFAGHIGVRFDLLVLTGGVILLTSVSRSVGGIALVTYKGVRHVSNSAAAGAVVGISGIAGLGALWGAAGGFLGEVLAESTVLVWQVAALFSIRRRKFLGG